MAYIQSQFSFRRPLPNLFEFELDIVCKVILMVKCILRLRKISRQRKINTMECKWQILHHYSNYVQHGLHSKVNFLFGVHFQISSNCELDVVCKVILIFKCILRLRKTSRQRKINIMECKWQIFHHYSN